MINRTAKPHHIGIIMDGNGRWAQSRGQPRIAGHQAGVEAARRIIKACTELPVQVLTLYVFSTENWKRPLGEVSYLMRLAEKYAHNDPFELHQNDVRVQLMGRRQKLPPTLLDSLDEIATKTRNNKRLILNLAINYSGRAEIVDAIKSITQARHQGEINEEDLNSDFFARFLYCPEVPDVDLIIRTGGEQRLSNFLLWRSVGAVFWSTPTYWPDFQDENLLDAIEFYREQNVRSEGEKIKQFSKAVILESSKQ
jgi:undecaprenyl diphosphate synthase